MNLEKNDKDKIVNLLINKLELNYKIFFIYEFVELKNIDCL